MLQRIQSIWLFFATAAIFSLFLFPYLQIINFDGSIKLLKVTGVYQSLAGQTVQTEAFLGLTIATVILGLLPFVGIFLYKNRKQQLTFSYLTIVLIIAFSFWIIQTAKSIIGPVTLEANNYGIGIMLPSVAVLFMILAIKGIRRDDKLVKSVDRLR